MPSKKPSLDSARVDAVLEEIRSLNDAELPYALIRKLVLERRKLRLSDAEEYLVQLIREAGKRQKREQLMQTSARDGKLLSEGTTKIALAALVRNGVLNNRQDVHPQGYGLPEWD